MCVCVYQRPICVCVCISETDMCLCVYIRDRYVFVYHLEVACVARVLLC